MDPIDKLEDLRKNIGKVFFGKRQVIDQMIICLMAGGHALVQDVPGIGKTILAHALAKSVNCSFARIQLTPDLLPSDILGVSVYNSSTGNFEFKSGPIFANIILADEINRTTPRTQSALLEAMNEAQVTVDGRTIKLKQPFIVIATQNPFEFEGTYFLPENQLDRFTLRVTIGYPDPESEARIIREEPLVHALNDLQPVINAEDAIQLQQYTAAVKVEQAVMDYVLNIVAATREHQHLDLGVSPRGSLALVRASQAHAILDGRDYLLPDDIKQMAVPVCAHRVLSKSYLQNSRSTSTDQIIASIVESVPVPM